MVEVTDPVQLVIASDPRQIRLARLVAGGFGSLLGMDVDALDDFRIAVDELCVWLIECGAGGPISIELRSTNRAVEVTGSCAAAPDVDPDDKRNHLALQILAVAVESHRIEHRGDSLHFWLRTHPLAGS